MFARQRTTRRMFLGNSTIGAAAATASDMVPYVPWIATGYAARKPREGFEIPRV